MAKGWMDYLKRNAGFQYGGGLIGGAFLAGDIKGIMDSDNKLKALLKTLKDFALVRVAVAGVFTAVGAAVKSLVRDTGSLDQALKKLNQMQVFSRQLSGFVGGLQNARKRIAELNEVGKKGPFRFEELAEANKSLEIFTRGAYSSVAATKEIGQAALATGNNITDTARAVGNFYDNLRSGGPIEESAEHIRQMGLVSAETADHLVKMANGGESAASVFAELNSAMAQTASGAEGYKNELASITAEHEKAKEELQEAFGAPFTEREVKNVQNMTDAMKAITPAVSKIAQSMAVLYTGFSTAKTGVAKFAAENENVRGIMVGVTKAIQILTVAAVVYGTYAAVTFTPLLATMGQKFMAMGAAAKIATVTVRGLALATVWGLVIAGITGVIGAYINMQEAIKQVKKDFLDWAKSSREAVASVLAQAAAVKTLTDKNEALSKSYDTLIDKQKELKDLEGRSKERQERIARLKELEAGATGGPRGGEQHLPSIERKKLEEEEKFAQKRIKQTKAAQEIIKQSISDQTKRQPLHDQLIAQESARRASIEEIQKGPEERRRESLQGLKESAAVERDRSEIQSDRIGKEKQLKEDMLRFADRDKELGKKHPEQEEARKKKHQEQFKTRQNEINELLKKEQAIALGASGTSAVNLEAKAEQLRQAKVAKGLREQLESKKGASEEEKAPIRQALSRAEAVAGGVTWSQEAQDEAETQAALAKKREEAPPSPETIRAARVQEFQIRTDIEGKEARSKGDVKTAQAAEDVSALTSNFEALLPIFGKDKAASVALAQTQQDIKGQYIGAAQVTSSLQAIGGGGGASGVNPELQSARRREDLQVRMVELLQILTGQEASQPTQPSFLP